MTTATEARSGKSHRDENFPVASHLIHPRHRRPILAFYDFVRAGDDVADNAGLDPSRKVALLDGLAAALTGTGPDDPEAAPLRAALAERGLSPRHALDLLDAFRMDARKSRYASFDELMHYCRYSAMPVGRFVLDVHGEDPAATWAASDAICAALQIINHLQDCGKDFSQLDRVYLPEDLMATHGVAAGDLGAPRASPGLRAVIGTLAHRCLDLLHEGRALPDLIEDTRLAMEIAAIHRLAVMLARGLTARDPLSQRVHHGKAAFALIALGAAGTALARRPFRRHLAPSVRGARP
ncbi:squalene synthase HpnC [Methylobacterium sp. 4-46]|uniref:squalene synthase HpnC n=1 Tax=unclassified Methylobacterium TaxID=2615210 RepID=UPI000152CDCC|nr:MULTISPECIES: squalene synthase HpnC [Methylobacterium]ACA20614.1 squalene synthase HpnC [Methylobacterium sp. 4-46]WFT79779.1 squalene synthase HpnC [Methylobacterium nodulans]